MDEKPKKKRRWYQFSLRTFLLLMTGLSFLLGWGGLQIKRYIETSAQQRRIWLIQDSIEKRGGVASMPNGRVAWIHLRGPKISDATLVGLPGLNETEGLNLTGARITDLGTLQIKPLSQLLYLNLSETQITDVGLANLKGLTQLQSLNLSRTRVTDAGLVHLGGMTELNAIVLINSNVTGAGYQKLQETFPKAKILR